MSSEQVEKALNGTRGWFVFTDPEPAETLDSKQEKLRDALRIEVVKAEAHEHVRANAQKARERR